MLLQFFNNQERYLPNNFKNNRQLANFIFSVFRKIKGLK